MNTLTSKQEEIAVRAYYLYIEGGCQSGRDLDYWFEAEKAVGSHFFTPPDEKPASAPKAAKKPAARKAVAEKPAPAPAKPAAAPAPVKKAAAKKATDAPAKKVAKKKA